MAALVLERPSMGLSFTMILSYPPLLSVPKRPGTKQTSASDASSMSARVPVPTVPDELMEAHNILVLKRTSSVSTRDCTSASFVPMLTRFSFQVFHVTRIIGAGRPIDKSLLLRKIKSLLPPLGLFWWAWSPKPTMYTWVQWCTLGKRKNFKTVLAFLSSLISSCSSWASCIVGCWESSESKRLQRAHANGCVCTATHCKAPIEARQAEISFAVKGEDVIEKRWGSICTSSSISM